MFFWFLLGFLTTEGLIKDYIHDPVIQMGEEKIKIHSSGLLSYGAHTNTFHLRYAYMKIKQNLEFLQWWCTLRGYADTHIPETNYGYNLNNLSLYDYGIEINRGGFFIHFRGAAIPRWNAQSFLLLPAEVRSDNPGEFDASRWYQPQPVNAAGIRFGWRNEYVYFSYSQGDYRHLIPMGLTLHVFLPWFQWRNTLISYNGEPETYNLHDYHYFIQSSLSSIWKLEKSAILFLSEVNYRQKENRLGWRFEQGLRWESIQLAVRELWWDDLGWNVEIGGMYFFAKDAVALGCQISTEGKIYIGMRVDF